MYGETLTYADAGVNIKTGNSLIKAIGSMVAETERVGVNGTFGGFGGTFDLKKTGYHDPILVAASDGVGTKLKLAIEIQKHDTIGIDLVAMCVNDLITQGAEPLFFLDYFACGKLNKEIAKKVIKGIVQGCKKTGCALLGGETAEMPGFYTKDDYDLAGFSVGIVERRNLLPKRNLKKGDVLLGLRSDGIHSNGYSLVRYIIDKTGIESDTKIPFVSSKRTQESFYSHLLKPTRIYVSSILNTQKKTNGIKALAHITGGGIIENIPRVLPDNLAANIDLAKWSPQPVFGWLRNKGNIDDMEMLKTFNCGIGMVAVVGENEAEQIENELIQQKEKVVRIGKLVEREKSPVTFVNKMNWAIE